MTLTTDEQRQFAQELEVLWSSPGRKRVEFTISHWYVTMYRLGDSSESLRKTIRVDFLRRDIYTKEERRVLAEKRTEALEREQEVLA